MVCKYNHKNCVRTLYEMIPEFCRIVRVEGISTNRATHSHLVIGGGSTPKNPKKPKPKMGFQTIFGFFGFFGFFLEKGVESTYLNIPDHLRPTCFLHFFREISPGSDT